ncbi:MAG TPA: translation elongation factor 4 [Anaerolineae bacterium]|nr:translation elongation factor 4 [Anaerolineae bacterium]
MSRQAVDQQRIRNFCIIAHIDHGKSTLADRLLERTGTLTRREMVDQVLDTMDLERERGVTIKASAVRMSHSAADGYAYELNLIDTPGHVDFTYEVSRALAACEGALLVVDASQGVQAQTLGNLYLALDAGLTIIPVINKIDLISARPQEVAQEVEELLGIPAGDALYTSAKDGTGVADVLEAVVARVSPPRGLVSQPLRALIFDSHYDAYKGVIAYVRVVDGELAPERPLALMSTNQRLEAIEVGVFRPGLEPCPMLSAGEVGYVATGLKTLQDLRVGDTFTLADDPAEQPLPGYRPAKPMVFAGLYPAQAEDYDLLRDALAKLQLNDASISYEPETSQALGFGFRCGFLGLFHMDIIQERLEREYDLDIVFTSPSVEYQVLKTDGSVVTVDNPARLPQETEIAQIDEPWMQIQVFTPAEFVGPVMDLIVKRRGELKKMEYLDTRRVLLTYEIPLTEILVDFYDQLKSRTKGYASLDYAPSAYREGDLVRVDVLVASTPVDALSVIVHRDQSYLKGQRLVTKMRHVIPRQQFEVVIQASVGKRVISRAVVKPVRKDVLAKCYGGDITRKRKLLEKQKKGKKRMKMIGYVEVPQEAFMTVLRLDEE